MATGKQFKELEKIVKILLAKVRCLDCCQGDGEESTNWFTGDQTQTDNRVHDGADFNTQLNNLGNFELNIDSGEAGSDAFRVNVTGGLNSSYLDIQKERASIVTDNSTEQSSLILDNGTYLTNSAGNYFLGDGLFSLTPPASDVTPDYNIGIDSTSGKLYRTTKALIPTDLDNLKKDQIGILIDGGGEVITTGFKGRYRVPYDGFITGWTILEVSEVPVTGDIEVDVKLGIYSDYDTTPIFASIAGSELPTISTDVKGQNNALTTWSSIVNAGDLIEYTVNSVTDLEKVQLFIDILKS